MVIFLICASEIQGSVASWQRACLAGVPSPALPQRTEKPATLRSDLPKVTQLGLQYKCGLTLNLGEFRNNAWLNMKPHRVCSSFQNEGWKSPALAPVPSVGIFFLPDFRFFS